VTGISDGGIGAAIAGAFVFAGADVALFYRTAEAAAATLAETLGAHGASVRTYGGDLRDEDTVRQMFDSVVADFGRLDVLVNNAATQPVVPLDDMRVADWREVIDTNTASTFLCSQAAVERMGPGGAIVHIGSIEGHRMAHGHAHYCASKAAVLMHARSAAVEYAPRGVRVNSVSPGLIERDGLREAWPDGVHRWEAAAPAARLGRAADVANACVFLASPLAEWITGTDLVVDGGVSAVPTW
jgi:NAD(P)-dependent dehydrogenase (short-subunit alcohol dehydrogenase family)